MLISNKLAIVRLSSRETDQYNSNDVDTANNLADTWRRLARPMANKKKRRIPVLDCNGDMIGVVNPEIPDFSVRGSTR